MDDVFCYGAICADLCLYLPRFPQPGDGVHVPDSHWRAGGNALNEARALVGWGARVALAGDDLGADPAGDLVAAELGGLGLAGRVRRDAAARTPICHILITPDGQRTILALRDPRPPMALPAIDDLAAARVVSLARYGPPGIPAVAELARRAGRPLVVGDVTTPDDPLASHADVIVTSAETLARRRPGRALEAQLADLHAVRGAAVVVSDGPRPARVLWGEADGPQIADYQPPIVATRDTTGAGDVFRAGVAWGLLQRWPWPQILAFASEQASQAIGADRVV